MRIGTNILAMTAQRNLDRTTKAFARALERLASGQRINRAGDDAAGLAVSTGLESQLRGLRQGTRNLNDASNILQAADGTLGEMTNLVQRMWELGVQSSTGTLSDSE